jgi:hypothetical protein
VHQVVQPQATNQLAFIRLLEGQLVLVSPVNRQLELERLLFQLLALLSAVLLRLAYTLLQERLLPLDSQTNLQYDLLFPQEVLLVQEMAILLFSPFTHIYELHLLVVLELQITLFFTQTLEPLKVQVQQQLAIQH